MDGPAFHPRAKMADQKNIGSQILYVLFFYWSLHKEEKVKGR